MILLNNARINIGVKVFEMMFMMPTWAKYLRRVNFSWREEGTW